MSWRSIIFNRQLPHPYEAAGKPMHKWTDADRRWVDVYQNAFNTAVDLDNALLRARDEISRLTHENEFMLRVVNERDGDSERPTLRDRLAMAAMQGDWAAPDTEEVGLFTPKTSDETFEANARLYYRMADAMLAVRNEKPEDEK